MSLFQMLYMGQGNNQLLMLLCSPTQLIKIIFQYIQQLLLTDTPAL